MLTSDTSTPPKISFAQSEDGTTFTAAAQAMLSSGSPPSNSPLTGVLLDMDYDPRSDTLYLLTDAGPLRSKSCGATWET